jgi:hypothetical protein
LNIEVTFWLEWIEVEVEVVVVVAPSLASDLDPPRRAGGVE